MLAISAGSGKTHTLIGNIKSSVDKGLVPRAAAQLCQAVQMPPSGCTIQLSMSVVEIYCERIRDLLVNCTEGSPALSITQVLSLTQLALSKKQDIECILLHELQRWIALRLSAIHRKHDGNGA